VSVFEAIGSEGYGEPPLIGERFEERVTRLVSLGLPRDEVEIELRREAARDFAKNGVDWHVAYPSLLTWTWGTVPLEESR
jgi:hypothetical protein